MFDVAQPHFHWNSRTTQIWPGFVYPEREHFRQSGLPWVRNPAERNMFYRSEMSGSEASNHQMFLYNTAKLQFLARQVTETFGDQWFGCMCVCVCGHAQHMYIDITAGSQMRLETHTEKETQYNKCTVCCNKYFSSSIPCCISYLKKVLGFSRKDCCHKQQSIQNQCFFGSV